MISIIEMEQFVSEKTIVRGDITEAMLTSDIGFVATNLPINSVGIILL